GTGRQMQASEVHGNEQDSVFPKAGIDRQKIAETAREEQGACQEHKRDGDLQRHERAPKTNTLAADSLAAASGVHRGLRADAGGAHKRNQAEQKRGEAGHKGGETEDAPAQAQVEEEGAVTHAEIGNEKLAEHVREEKSQR